MSAELCGCDKEANWMCLKHQMAAEKERDAAIERARSQSVGGICMLCQPNEGQGYSQNPNCPVCAGTGFVLANAGD